LQFKLNCLPFLETHEIDISKVGAMEEDLLSTLGADESEPTVAE